jgi:hypothetical protein
MPIRFPFAKQRGTATAAHPPRQSHDAAFVTASAEKKWLNGWSAGATSRSYAGKGMRLFVVFRDFRYWALL